MITVTSTTGTNVTFTYSTWVTHYPAPMSDKERKRRARAAARHEKMKRVGEEWLQKRMQEIREWSAANAWRPNVGFNETTAGLHYWTLVANNEEDPNLPNWRTIYYRYKKKGWLGLTINCPTPIEKEAIDAVIASIPKKYKIVEQDRWRKFKERSDSTIGRYDDYFIGVWFARLEDHNRMVEALERYPRVTQMMMLASDKRGAVENLFAARKVNYRIIDGDQGSCVIFSEIDDTTMVMLRLFGTGEAFPLR